MDVCPKERRAEDGSGKITGEFSFGLPEVTAGGPSCIIPPGRDRVPTLRAGCPRTALMGYLCNVTCEMPPGSCTSFELKEKAPRVKGR